MTSDKLEVLRRYYEDAVFFTLMAFMQKEDSALAVAESARVLAQRLEIEAGLNVTQVSRRINELASVVNDGAKGACKFYVKYISKKQFNIRKKQKKEKHINQITRVFRSIAKFSNEDMSTNPDLCRVCARVYVELNVGERLLS